MRLKNQQTESHLEQKSRGKFSHFVTTVNREKEQPDCVEDRPERDTASQSSLNSEHHKKTKVFSGSTTIGSS